MAEQARSARTAAIFGTLFALGWPFLLLLLPGGRQQNVANAHQDVQIIVAEYLAAIVLIAVVVFWERVPFAASIGVRPLKRADVAIVCGLAALALIAAGFVAINHMTFGTAGAQYAAVPLSLRIAVVFTAGICEEFYFRGFALERLATLTGNVWIAASIVIAGFTLAHVGRYGFSPALGVVALVSAVITLLYVWRRNLLPCIALHWFIDGLPLLVLPMFSGHGV